MNNTINFGAKIPIAKCQIQKTLTKASMPATIYEYDCKDVEDWVALKNQKGSWAYLGLFTERMLDKYNLSKAMEDFKCYVIEGQKGELLGFVQTKDRLLSTDIQLLETSANKEYKYTGKTLLSTVAKIALRENRNNLTVSYPVDSALDFYVKGCGFEPTRATLLRMNKEGMQELISKTQEQTKAQIVDLIG